jgi:hypothetical protein
MAKKLTSEKAKEILRDKSVHGKPLTEKQKKFFGAIAGGAKPYKAEDGGWLDRYETPSAQTGITTCPPGFVNIEGKCFDRSSDAYKKLYQYGIGYMDDKDVLVSSRMDLPEVVLKPKAALDFLDRIDASDRTRYSFDQMTKKFGAIPNIKPKGKSSFIAEELFKFFDPSNKRREFSRTATYDPFTKTARVDNMEEYISELAHHADKNILESAPYRFLRYGLPNRLKGKNLYDVPGTDEYIAHSIIEPQIKDFINKDSGYVDEILLPRIIDSRSPEERKRIMGEAWTEYVPPTENKKREGGVLKQKTKDNYGTKPNANNSDVSLPPGFKGWAYNTKGRNYSPAWGGQFAMGGNLPGATGMMYARTINPAPSNGPYAKKTKASAQDGKQLSYSAWKKKHNLKETEDYNLKRAWELGYAPDKTGHLPTVDNQTGEFLKAKGHPTLQLELDWYNSPEAADFRSKNIIDSSGKFFKYVPKSQNGQEMKFYQAGLDFTPKTISQDGLKLIPRAVGDLQGPKIDPRMSSNIAAAQEKDRQAQVRVKQEFVGPAAPRTKEHEAYRKRKLAEIAATNPEVRLNDSGELETSPYGDFMKSYGKNLDKFVTSLETPLAIMDVAMAGPLVGKFLPKISPGILSAKNLKEVSRSILQGIPTERSLPRLLPDELKPFRQVQEIGRLKATGARSAEQMKYALENNLPEEHFQKVFNRSKKEAEDLLASGFGKQEAQIAQTADESLNRETMQAIEDFNNRPVTPELQAQRDRLRARLRALSNRPAETGGYGTINTQGIVDRDTYILETAEGLSQSTPPPLPELGVSFSQEELRRALAQVEGGESKFTNTTSNIIGGAINAPKALGKKANSLLNKYTQEYPYYSGEVIQKVPSLSLSAQGTLKNVSKKVEFAPEGIKSGDVFTGSLNTSHSSYLPQLKQVFKYRKGEPQFLGYRPMNEMGFLSEYGYSAKDIAKYLNTEIDEQVKRGLLPKNIQRPYVSGGLTSPNKVVLPQYGIRQYQKGGQISVDPMGYWNPENWGKPVTIPSTDITMQGVYEPLIGISDTGDVQYMEPGEDYTFDGEYVTEYPMAKEGISVNEADAQPIKKLDQLLNFTNYNKPTKGGWLNKYQ